MLTADKDFSGDLTNLGFERAGHYSNAGFEIAPQWRKRCSVYVWTLVENSYVRPVRVGIACGTGGLGGRHTLHSRWLAGLFKPDDAREQEIARLTRFRLGSSAGLFAREVRDRNQAREVEKGLVALWRPYLDLDLTLSDSWLKGEMNAWRRGPGPMSR